MPDSVELDGFDEAQAKMAAAPAALRKALLDTTREATGVVAAAIRGGTPIHSGRLLSGWQTRVEATVDGATGKISNKVRYLVFVNRGNHPYRPMRAQPFVAEGVAVTTGTVRALYEANVVTTVEAMR